MAQLPSLSVIVGHLIEAAALIDMTINTTLGAQFHPKVQRHVDELKTLNYAV